MNRQELESLIATVLGGAARPDDVDRLARELEHNPEARGEISRHLDLIAALETSQLNLREFLPPRDEDRPARPHEPGPIPPAEPEPKPPGIGSPPGPFLPWWVSWAAVLVMGIFTAGISVTAYAKLNDAEAEKNARAQEMAALTKEKDRYARELEKALRGQGSYSREWEFDEARKVDVILNYEGDPTQVGFRFLIVPGPPYYTGVDFHPDVNDPSKKPVELYNEGYVPFKPVVTARYQLPRTGTTIARAEFKFYVHGAANTSLGLTDKTVLVESIPLKLTPDGIHLAADGLADAVTISVEEPGDEAPVQRDFRLDFKVRVDKPEAAEGVIHVLVRPLDGPDALRNRYWVQPFRLDVKDLLAAGKDRDGRLSTWVSLGGVLAEISRREKKSPPTRFQVSIVVLPVRLTRTTVPESLLQLGGPNGEGFVKAELEVRLPTPAGSE
jgi:hypothetical protein